ncbi:hypothetical protein QH494_26390 [Sphingomonas sp. AR_OL41]|uniref:hypothetical protein n=1 Tax=Sphingomonas sp. AR_OL41 TaxID=3042729 RepID=UPI00248041D9|nr:hypothetical protein [Sphingomonas sp. AR_OL41]MDH7975731.1 hypothetical protein [Sphingomonas sp. AR_OL41]
MSPHTTSFLSPIQTGWQALHHAILADGTLAVVVTDVDLAKEWMRIYASNGQIAPPSRIDRLTKSGRAQLLTWGADGWQDGPIFPLETPHPRVDRFSDGRWLMVGSRTRRKPNARVISSDGALLGRFMLGDGIEHIAIDSADRIWVGWFDEGMFGGGWSVPGMEWPPSSNGVACFAPDGSVVEVPSWPEEAGMIADCYVLTPAGSGVWTSPYTDFPLVRFVPGEPARWWRNELAGPKAIAVDATYALVAGGYRDDAARLALVHLDEPGSGQPAVPLATWRMPLRPAPPPLNDWAPVWETPSLLTGRDSTLHLIDDGKWHQWRVADAVAALGLP